MDLALHTRPFIDCEDIARLVSDLGSLGCSLSTPEGQQKSYVQEAISLAVAGGLNPGPKGRALGNPGFARGVSRAVSNLLWGVAKLGETMRDWYLEQLVTKLLSCRPHAKAVDIAATIWAVGKMGQSLPQPALRLLLAELCRQALYPAPAALSDALWGVANLGRSLPPQQLQLLLQQFLNKLDYAGPKEIADLLWAVATIRGTVAADRVAQLVTRCSELLVPSSEESEQLPQNTSSSCDSSSIACTVLWAVAVLDAQELLQQRGARCARGAVLKLLGVAGAAAEAAMEADTGRGSRNSSFGSEGVQHPLSAAAGIQLYQFYIWVQDQGLEKEESEGGRWQVAGGNGDAGILNCVSPAALRWCARVWHQEMEESCHSSESARQRALATALRGLDGPGFEVLPPGQLSEDGMLRVGHGVRVTPQAAAGTKVVGGVGGRGPVMVAVELAGALQLLAPDMIPEGGMAAQHKALQARGWRVVVVMYHEFDEQGGQEQQVEYLRQRIQEVVKGV